MSKIIEDNAEQINYLTFELCKEEKFYGYITGIRIVQNKKGNCEVIATFIYQNEVVEYIIADVELVKILQDYLFSMAWEAIETGCWGYSKLWIQYADEKWKVETS
jgi:hypothetical protein